MNPLVCIVLVNYNGFEDTRECIESLKKCGYDNLRIIVVDNASEKAPVKYDEVISEDICEIMYLAENKGFAGGNNEGIRCAQKYNPEYYLLLNNDTVVTKGFLTPLIQVFDCYQDVGIVTSKILYWDDKKTIWFGGSYYNRELGEFKIRGIGEPDNAQYDQVEKVEYCTGCLCLLSNKTLEKAGLMSEDYFLYYEDADYCERVKDCGLSIYYQPLSCIYHKESRSTKKGSSVYQYYNNRNYLLFIKRNAHQTAKIRLYFKRLTRMLKETFRGRMKYKMCLYVWHDFLNNKVGKTKRRI